jgi:hypothetical protein
MYFILTHSSCRLTKGYFRNPEKSLKRMAGMACRPGGDEILVPIL